MIDNNWYFDNVTEDIIFGDINAGRHWIVTCRTLKKNAIIRKYGNDTSINTDALPAVLGKAVDRYRGENKIQGGNANAHI